MGQNQKGVDVLIKSIAQAEVNMTNLAGSRIFQSDRFKNSRQLGTHRKVLDSPEGWFDLAGVQASNGSRAGGVGHAGQGVGTR